MQGIKPSTLAGLLCALITPFQVSRPEVVVALDPSDDLQLLVEELAQDAVHLASIQAQKGIMCPIEIDLKCAFIFACAAPPARLTPPPLINNPPHGLAAGVSLSYLLRFG